MSRHRSIRIDGSGSEFREAPMASQQQPLKDASRIDIKEAKAKMDKGEDILFVDVRAPHLYDRVHIKGAKSLPLIDLINRYEELPKDKLIIFY